MSSIDDNPFKKMDIEWLILLATLLKDIEMSISSDQSNVEVDEAEIKKAEEMYEKESS